MPNPLEGKHYDREMRGYVLDVVPVAPDPFTVIVPKQRVDLTILPTSPRSTAKRATEMGWEVSCWATVGHMAPTLYLSDADVKEGEEEGAKPAYREGDVRFDGYRATIYVVEAREFRVPLGFQAFYLGKHYKDGDKRNTAGSFDWARIADPVGVPVELTFAYEPIKVQIGRDPHTHAIIETEASFKSREKSAGDMARRLREEHNDGATYFPKRLHTTSAKDLTAWLAEWAEYGFLTHREEHNA